MAAKRKRSSSPVKDVLCYAVSARPDGYPYLIYSRTSLEKQLRDKKLKITDLPDSPILSYALSTECDEYGGGMGWRSYTVPHRAHGFHNLLQHLQQFDIYSPNKKQHTDDDTTQTSIMDQMEQHISSNTTSLAIYHAISLKDKKWVTLRITRMKEQESADDIRGTIAALKTALLAAHPTLCCQDCGQPIKSADDLAMTPTGQIYCQTCY